MIDWLRQVLVKARLSRAFPIPLLPIAGQRDQPCGLHSGNMTQTRRDLEPTHARQADVQEHHVRPEGRNGGEGARPICGRADVMSVRAEKPREVSAPSALSSTTSTRQDPRAT
jgi:hypothetical protein